MNDPTSWYGKRAPTGLKTYGAWETDPTRDPYDTSLDQERPRGPRLLPVLVFLALAVLAFCWGMWGR